MTSTPQPLLSAMRSWSISYRLRQALDYEAQLAKDIDGLLIEARREGLTWRELAEGVGGISPQGLHQRFQRAQNRITAAAKKQVTLEIIE